MQLYINCGPNYIQEQRQQQKQIMNRVLELIPEAKQDTCYKCGFKGLCNVSHEEYKKLDAAGISYVYAWIFNNDNTSKQIGETIKENKQICDVCNNIEITQREIREKKKAINKYMRLLAKPKYICQICSYRNQMLFNSKQELKQHIQQDHDSYYIKKELE